MSKTPITKEEFLARPEVQRTCQVTGELIPYEVFIKGRGLYVHPSLYAIKKRLKCTNEFLRIVLPSFLHSTIHDGYYQNWKALAAAESQLGATPEELEAFYTEKVEPNTQCRFPGCNATVPYDLSSLTACSGLHYKQATRIQRGDYSLEDLKYKCALCDNGFSTKEGVGLHLRDVHKYSDADMAAYYTKYVMTKDDNDGHCKWCNAETTFRGVTHGYRDFCFNTDCGVRWHNKNTARLKKSGEGIKKSHAAGDVVPSQLGYWLKKGLSEAEAEAALRERQTTNSVKSIMRAKGVTEDEAKVLRRDITHKWLKSRTTGLNWSKVSQELFWEVWNTIGCKFDPGDVFFATFDKGVRDESKNREYRIQTTGSYRLPDFYIHSLDISIEFDGAWHHAPESWRGWGFDQQRDAEILEARPKHKILHIKETAYRKNKAAAVAKCLGFILTQQA